MFVAGIDVSTRAIDIVLVPLDEGPPVWHRFDLEHHGDAFDRTRQVPLVVPGPAHTFWDDVLAVGIEEPAGRTPGYAFRVQGAVLACIPREKLVTKLMPSEWRRSVGLKGNATKDEVSAWAHTRRREHDRDLWPWPQDACDAYCIALATSQAIEHKESA